MAATVTTMTAALAVTTGNINFSNVSSSSSTKLLNGLVRIDMLINMSKHSMKTDLSSYKVSNDLHQQH
eukprot:8573-Heterococcus_DN1.PRE.1